MQSFTPKYSSTLVRILTFRVYMIIKKDWMLVSPMNGSKASRNIARIKRILSRHSLNSIHNKKRKTY